jgi:hypothetical protein
MPVSTPSGYLDFTNATPRATKVIATSNVGIGTSDPIYSLDVMGTANVGALTATSVDIAGGLSLDLPVATIASNLVTYDTTTGELFDSGGLFSNKLSVVSEQPPSALSGASTTVEKHGIYKVTASTGTPQNAFDKVTSTTWTASSSYTGGGGTGVYVGSTNLATGLEQGDWVAVELPYKATLRHLTLTAGDGLSTSLPEKANLYATNDTVTWTELKNWQAGETTVLVNATEPYKKYAIVTTKTAGNATLQIGQLKLFCESFSVDGGKIEMATSALTGGASVMDQTTAHAREPAVLKKYPEVQFVEGKFDYNDSTRTYTQGGYTVTASNESTNNVWKMLDGDYTTSWGTNGGAYNAGSPGTVASSGSYPGEIITLADSTQHDRGHWMKIKFPHKVRLSNYYIRSGSPDRRPASISILGSNDDNNWYIVKDVHSVGSETQYTTEINASTAYRYAMLLVHSIVGSDNQMIIDELEYYGTEETATEGDTSLDTSITSKYNTPDLTSASLYLDGLKGSTATDYSGRGIAVTENNVTWDSTEKSWTLSGAANSNVVSADLGFEGDQPHSVSAWVKADQLNGRELFHVGTAEGEGDAASRVGFVDDSHISWGGEDHYFSNAEWHNVTYTYNGEGSDKKLYLDGRLVGTAANEDTFGDYPPFAMSTYSQYGYTVSASSELSNYPVHYAFDGNTTHAFSANSWICAAGKYDSTGGTGLPVSPAETTTVDGVSKEGEWVQMEFPQRMILDSVSLAPQTDTEQYRAPKDAVIAGSNDGTTWETMRTFTGETSWTDDVFNNYIIDTNVGKSYKYVRIIVLRNQGIINSNTQYTAIAEIKFYARRENDLVRFPDPTNVLKYPHVAMTGPAQRGYVATMSSPQSSIREAWNSFDNNSSTWSEHAYNSVAYAASGATNGNQATTNNIDGSGTYEGEWIQIQFPRKVNISRYELTNRNNVGYRMPKTAKLIGSNDGSNWTTVYNHSDSGGAYTSSGQETRNFDVSSSTGYKYFRLITNELFPGVSFDTPNIATWNLYGTEPEDVVTRIGDGYDGKVRNLRVFSTALSQDRVQEIFDADKDEFALAKSSVSVYRGHLGIGTTEPKAALTVMDEVGELEEFPPRAMTADETYMEGHGVFRATSSPTYNNNYPPYNAFDKNVPYNTATNQWVSQAGTYDGASPNSFPVTSGNTVLFNGTLGSWIQLEMPYKIILKEMRSFIRVNRNYEHPTSGILYGSNDGGNTYERVYTFDNVEVSRVLSQPVVHRVNLTKAYSTFAFQITKLYGVRTFTNLGELKFFGTREQGASTLHNGELTLTRNLTVPRIGPALDADDTPRRDRLVVEYNTSTNPTENGVVKDTSGRGLDGRMVNGSYYDATEKALVFDGTDDTIRGTQNIGTGEKVLTMAMWIKRSAAVNTYDYVCTIGTSTSSQMAGFAINSNKFNFTKYGAQTLSTTTINNGQWYHVVGVYKGGNWDTTNTEIYVNGVKETITGGTTSALNLTGNQITFGDSTVYDGTSSFNGSISNFKLYDVAITADEVKRLYDMGRCDEGHHVVNFSKTRVGIGLGDGGVPQAALDVRGSALFGNVGINTSPAGNLHVRDSRGNETPATIILQPSSNQYSRGYAKIEGFHDASLGAGTGLRFYTRQDSGSDFAADSLVYERMRISNAGNVGIGTTSPVAQLHVASHGPTYTGLSGNDRFRIEEQATNGNSYGLQMGIDWGTGHSALQTYFLNSNGSYSQGYNLLLQPHGGNVGIGTTNPTAKLHVNGSFYAPGSVIQCQTRTFGLSYSTTSTTYTYSGAYVSITPKFANSKMFVMFDGLIYIATSSGSAGMGLIAYKSINGGTDQLVYSGEQYTGGNANAHNIALYVSSTPNYLHSRTFLSFGDSSNTTSSITYKIYARSQASGKTTHLGNSGHQPLTFTVFEIAQ